MLYSTYSIFHVIYKSKKKKELLYRIKEANISVKQIDLLPACE